MGHPTLDFLIAQSNRFQRERFCPRCGNPFTFVDAVFLVVGQDEASTVALPVCLFCDSEILGKEDSLMSAISSYSFNESGWKQAYIAALFQTDKSKTAGLIKAAEMAVVLRMREGCGALRSFGFSLLIRLIFHCPVPFACSCVRQLEHGLGTHGSAGPNCSVLRRFQLALTGRSAGYAALSFDWRPSVGAW